MVSDIRKADARAAIERGIKYRDNEDYDRAIKEFTEAVKLDPDNADAYHCRAHIYLCSVTQQMYEVAKLGPNDTDGKPVEIKFNVLETAIKDFNAAIRLDPKNPDVYVGRGSAYSALGKLDKAVKDYYEALKLGLDEATEKGLRQLLATIGSKI